MAVVLRIKTFVFIPPILVVRPCGTSRTREFATAKVFVFNDSLPHRTSINIHCFIYALMCFLNYSCVKKFKWMLYSICVYTCLCVPQVNNFSARFFLENSVLFYWDLFRFLFTWNWVVFWISPSTWLAWTEEVQVQ